MKFFFVSLLICLLSFSVFSKSFEEKYGPGNISAEEISRLWKVLAITGEAPKQLDADSLKLLIAKLQWQSNDNAEGLGSPKAKQGGTLQSVITSYPPSLRTFGKLSNSVFNTTLNSLVFEYLLGLHPITMKYTPALANKWYVAPDKMTFFYKFDPNAKWADGKPVQTYDYVATWDLATDEGIEDPFANDYWNKYERPVAITNDILMIKSKDLNWRTFLSASCSLEVLPAHCISGLTGKQYLKKYQFEMPPGSGPYKLTDSQTNISITLEKRKDYWGKDYKANKGTYNFDKIIFNCITDENLVKEKFKKGELDWMQVNVAREWHQDFIPSKMDKIAKGWIQKRKIFTHKPAGTSGMAFNIRVPPFNDVRVRKAIAHLYNRELLMDKLFFNEYIYLDSLFANSPYENKNNPKIRYDPDEAIDLLDQAGWKQSNINDEGYLVKDGKVFEIELMYVDKSSERIYTVFQEDLKAVGIKLILKQVTWATLIKELGERNFNMIPMGYSGLLFPNPESSLHSKFADKKNNNNIWGFKNQRVDEICAKYPEMFDVDERIAAVKEIDGIVTKEHIWALGWFANNMRLLYWNKFGMPEFYLSKYGNDPEGAIIAYWWFDPWKEEKLNKAMTEDTNYAKDDTTFYDEVQVKYWDEYDQKHGKASLDSL